MEARLNYGPDTSPRAILAYAVVLLPFGVGTLWATVDEGLYAGMGVAYRLLPIAGLAVFVVLAVRQWRLSRQSVLDRSAQLTAASVAEAPTRSASLAEVVAPRAPSAVDVDVYLRPFESIRMVTADVEQAQTLERELALMYRSSRRTLVAVGGHSETGFGHVGVDDAEWQSRVTELVEVAGVLVVLPALSPGTRWELMQIFSRGLVSKTLFVVPRLGDVPRRAEWEGVQAMFRGEGWLLPDPGEGAMVAFADGPSPWVTIGLGDSVWRKTLVIDLVREVHAGRRPLLRRADGSRLLGLMALTMPILVCGGAPFLGKDVPVGGALAAAVFFVATLLVLTPGLWSALRRAIDDLAFARRLRRRARMLIER